jgi:hypothetical protein
MVKYLKKSIQFGLTLLSFALVDHLPILHVQGLAPPSFKKILMAFTGTGRVRYTIGLSSRGDADLICRWVGGMGSDRIQTFLIIFLALSVYNFPFTQDDFRLISELTFPPE